MTFRQPFHLLLPITLFACGQAEQDPMNAGTDSPTYSSLAERVEAITGRPATEGGMAMEAGMEAGMEAYAGGQESGQRPSTGFRTVPIRINGFSMPAGQKQVPAHWNELPNGEGYTAPGVSVKNLQAENFTFVTGQMAQFYQQSGVALRAPVPPEQLVQQDLAPRMRQEGYEFVGQAPVPALERLNQQFLDNINTSNGQMRNSTRINLSEWRKGDSRVALLMTWMCFQGATTNWSYSLTRLETTADRYEGEKNAWLQGGSNVQYNPAFFAAFRQGEQQKQAQWQQNENMRTQQSWAAHNQRMQANQAAFDARQATHRDMVNSVNNSMMNTWNNTNASMDRQQQATINGIRGEQDAWNPHTGQQGKVEAGYNNYWVNSDGQYIGTNDVMYDPNMNGQWVDQWQQMPTEP